MDLLPKYAVAAGQGELRAWLCSLPPFPTASLLAPGQAAQCAATSSGSTSSGSGGNSDELWRAYLVLSFLSHVRSRGLGCAMRGVGGAGGVRGRE